MNPLSDTLLLKALDATSSPVTITDALSADNPIIYCNEAFVKLSGYGRDEIIGKNCRFLQTPDTDKAKVSELRQAIHKHTNISVTILNATKDGRIFWNDLQVSPVFNDQKEVTHFIGFQNDISERLEHERVLLLTQKLENEIELETLQSKNTLKFQKSRQAFIDEVEAKLQNPIAEAKQELAKMAHDKADAAKSKHIDTLIDAISAIEYGVQELKKTHLSFK